MEPPPIQPRATQISRRDYQSLLFYLLCISSLFVGAVQRKHKMKMLCGNSLNKNNSNFYWWVYWAERLLRAVVIFIVSLRERRMKVKCGGRSAEPSSRDVIRSSYLISCYWMPLLHRRCSRMSTTTICGWLGAIDLTFPMLIIFHLLLLLASSVHHLIDSFIHCSRLYYLGTWYYFRLTATHHGFWCI